ncbi:Phosphoglycerate mutase [Desulfarculus baarsii DSM 2075]|uniref:Phosphoglycerate mutase n=1 Tax=Desulfarculus baarsii (strain ATCC 33931 / DSM 2075 / LMG 7858 / VKM B-1802 / 2st14) TaxID=644282 RepID=E1QHM7_DESB2|nr:histidine phosphatase family protein [Desulfarculus baarsii]ADK85070.1 Phosphoglycerate mutase [Desulfarculus baarsii DSM 2075]
MGVIYFIRHGQASFASDNYDRLSGLGRRQSEILGQYLAETGMGFDAVYSGDMVRQMDTANIVLERLGHGGDELVIDPDLNEYSSFIILKALLPEMIADDPSLERAVEGMYKDNRSFQKVYEKGMLRWVSTDRDIPGLGSWSGFHRRTQQAIRRIMAENQGSGRRVAVFTSGGPISSVMNMALGLDDEVTLRITWQIVNSSITACKFSGDRFFLWSFNSIAHLDQARDAALITYR